MPPPHEQHSCGRSMRRALCAITSVADAKLVLRCSCARSRPCVLRLLPQASVRVHSGHSAPRFACAQLGAGAKGNVQRAHAIEQPAPERLNIFSCCGQCLQLSVVLASAEWHLQLSECCSRDKRRWHPAEGMSVEDMSVVCRHSTYAQHSTAQQWHRKPRAQQHPGGPSS